MEHWREIVWHRRHIAASAVRTWCTHPRGAVTFGSEDEQNSIRETVFSDARRLFHYNQGCLYWHFGVPKGCFGWRRADRVQGVIPVAEHHGMGNTGKGVHIFPPRSTHVARDPPLLIHSKSADHSLIHPQLFTVAKKKRRKKR